MKISDLNKIILTALFMLIVAVIAREHMEKYSTIILVIAIIGVLSILIKSAWDTYHKPPEDKNKHTKTSDIDIDISDSSKTNIPIIKDSAGAIVNINDKDDENNKKILMHNYLETALKEYKREFPISYINTLELAKEEKWDLCMKVHERLKSKIKPKMRTI